MRMLSLVLEYDPTTRMLDTPDEYAGTTIDNLSADITVNGIPEGYTARLDFRVKVRSAQGRMVYPFLILDAAGKCTLNVNILKACKADLKLPLQLVLSRDAGDGQQEIIASKNIVSLNVSPAINAMGSIETAYGLLIERAIVDVTEDGGEMAFTRLDGSTVTINVDDDFVAWSDVMMSWPADPGDETVPSVKAVDDTFLKSRLSQPDRLLMTDAVGDVDATGPRVVDAWSAVPSDDNLPTEKLVRDDLDTRALDADVVHNNRGTPVWSSLITYAQDSTVTYNGDLYISQNDSNTGNIPDELLTAWWTLVRGSGGGGEDDPGAYRAFLIGDGTSTEFVCNHGFNTYLTAHVIYSNLDDRETVDAVFERVSKNRTRVSFYTPPAEDGFTCVIYRPGLGPENVVTSFNGQTGDVEITGDDLDVLSTVAQDLTDSQKAQTKTNIDLENVDNTRDAIKPVSGPQQTALDGKVDKIAGKGLSTEDFSTAEKTKLSTVEEGAEINVNADWTAVEGDAQILNKPTLGSVAERDVGTSSGQVPILNVNGKLPDSVLPPLAIGEYAGSVSTKAELVTLANAQEGDIAKVTADPDINNDGVWFLNGVYSDLNAWIQIVGPGAVISVNGQGGVVVLTAADVGAVPTTRKVNNKALASDIVLGASDVSAVPNTRKVNNKALSSDIALTPADVGAVPPERTVNEKPLSADVVLTPADIGAVPPERTVNGHALSSDVVLDADDVGAVEANAGIVAGTFTRITVDAKGLVTLGEALDATDIPSLPASKIGSGTLDISRIPTGNAANKVLMLTEEIGTGQSIRRTAIGWEPFTPSSSNLALFTGTISGDGTTRVFTLNHGLNGIPVVTLYEDGEIISTTVVCTSSTIQVSFYTAPAIGDTFTIKAIS